jgi:hypothetical protein
MIKCCKNKYFTDFNTAVAWERLKNKYDPSLGPSLVNTERMLIQGSLCKNKDSNAWITTLKEFRMNLEDMGIVLTDDQFMIHLLNDLTNESGRTIINRGYKVARILEKDFILTLVPLK